MPKKAKKETTLSDILSGIITNQKKTKVVKAPKVSDKEAKVKQAVAIAYAKAGKSKKK